MLLIAIIVCGAAVLTYDDNKAVFYALSFLCIMSAVLTIQETCERLKEQRRE